MKKAVIAVACAAVLFGAGEDIQALKSRCDTGIVTSCGYLGVLYANGRGVTQDYYTLKPAI